MRLAVLPLLLLAVGCHRHVRIESVAFDKVEGGHVQVLADLDTDLRLLEYVMFFEHDLGTPDAVNYLGGVYDGGSLEASLRERRGAAVSEGPLRVRLHLPWDGRPGLRPLTLRLHGFRPYRAAGVDSEPFRAEIEIPRP